MIETIVPGTPKSKFFVGTCHSCKGTFRFEKEDARRYHAGDQRDGPFAQIACPTNGCTNQTVTGYPEQ